jgi:hypothetical protein
MSEKINGQELQPMVLELARGQNYAALTAVLIRVDPVANNQRGRRSWPHLQA